MYEIGSQVVHPWYGAGTIVRIQEKSIDESAHKYYVIDTVAKSMLVMVPVGRADSFGLRPVGKLGRLREVLASCCMPPAEEEIEEDYRTRQSMMSEQLKSGSFEKVTSAVRTLFFMNTRRTLGMTDRQMLERGKDILASELALASDLEVEAAMHAIEDHLAQMLPEIEA
jgi:CarD family transcriptional regulator